MKQIVLLLCCCVFATAGHAQLRAHAGQDTFWCLGLNPTATNGPILGAAPSATGGIPPYWYQWTIAEPGYLPSDYLSADTAANPQVIKAAPFAPVRVDSLHFVLRVTDNTNASYDYDTVVVYFSRIICITAECITEKDAEDSFGLSASCMGLLPPISYRWTPSAYLSSDAVANPITWTPVTQTYNLTITDRGGCSYPAGSCTIFVHAASVAAVAAEPDELMIAPNPLTRESMLRAGPAWRGALLEVFAPDGRLVARQRVSQSPTPIGSLLPQPGIYFYRIATEGGMQRHGRLVQQ